MINDKHTKRNGWKILFTYITVLTTICVFSSCKKADFQEKLQGNKQISTTQAKATTINPCGLNTQVNLIAGQNYNAGTVTIFNTSDSLYIELEATGDWWLQTVHIYAGELALMPQTPSGNPKVGQFPIQSNYNPKKKFVRFALSLTALPSCFAVAVHADVKKIQNGSVVQSETAWGQGVDLPGNSWAMAINYCEQTCPSCEFTTVATTIKAEQKQICGQLLITNDEDSLYVTYNMFTGWKIRKIQLFVGSINSMPIDESNNPLLVGFPRILTFTPAKAGETRICIPLNGLPANYSIAAHAETERSINGGATLIESAWAYGDIFPNATTWGWTVPYSTQFCD